MNTVEKSRITEVVLAAIEDVNEQLPRTRRLAKSPATILTGQGGQLDSLGLVNLLFNTEQRLEASLGVSVTLADAGTVAGEQFRTIGTFVEFVHALVEKAQHG